MAKLTDKTRLIVVQLIFSNPEAIPRTVDTRPDETQTEALNRVFLPTTPMVIPPLSGCSLGEFEDSLEREGYILVDAFHKTRVNVELGARERYETVRYIWARREFAEVTEDFRKKRPHISQEFSRIMKGTMWTVKAHINPFFVNGMSVPEQEVLTVVLAKRQPLFQPDGKPITVWQRDRNGQRVGTAPQPIRPFSSLVVQDGDVDVEPFMS